MNTDAQTITCNRPVAVIGAGPAGLSAAIGVALSGVPVVIAGPKPLPHARDTRTAALFGSSITFLRNLGVWDACRKHATPITAIRLIDGTERLMRAPELLFEAKEIGLTEFGYNIPNAALVDALIARSAELDDLTFCETAAVVDIEPTPHAVRLTTSDQQTISTALVMGADGRSSLSRQAAGIDTADWTYPQTAVVCNFSHSRPHKNISTEFHRRAGPLTMVPLPGNASSLVWVEKPGRTRRLLTLDDDAFAATLEDQVQGLLGDISDVTQRAAFPLRGLTAKSFAANRIALIGEAAHVIPPIGAQGLNLGFRDAATLIDIATTALRTGGDSGAPDVLAAYNRARRTDINTRSFAVDLLNRSLISNFLPVQALRGLGLLMLQNLPGLRRRLMREGIGALGHLPSLMRADSSAAAGSGLHSMPPADTHMRQYAG